MVEICQVEAGSLAQKAGIRAGDVLLRIDSHPIRDVLDYRFFLTEEKILLDLKRGEESFCVTIKKDRYDDIGLEFETFLMDQKKRCANRCIFCFIDQNPCGMRETVYFKDDDTRLSFLMGNYVTLTNVKDEELERIVKMRMSPVNVSVHTTSPTLRVKMLGNPRADRILEQLQILKEGDIQINCQIVACCGINDGAELERSVRDLEKFVPQLQSIAVVPAGLTAHRKGLPYIPPYERDSARGVVEAVERLAAEFKEKYGTRLIFAADEFYLKAALPIPPEEAYEGYPQLDNGVGLLRLNEEEILSEIQWRWEEGDWKKLPKKDLSITLATGFAAKDHMEKICAEIQKKLPFVKMDVVAVPNAFFGESVTVAGLLCGKDMIRVLKEKEPQILFVPAVALRHERDLFLDDTSLEEFEKIMGCPVFAIENGTPLLDEIENLLYGR